MARIGSLRYLAVNDASYPDVDYSGLLVDPGQPATSAWATRSDVKVWWKDGYVTDPRTVRKGDLKIGYADAGTWFGPEYAFGRVMGDHFTEPVLIIKTAWGGIDLAQGFRPPSAVAARGGVVGPYYNAMLDDVREVSEQSRHRVSRRPAPGVRRRGLPLPDRRLRLAPGVE